MPLTAPNTSPVSRLIWVGTYWPMVTDLQRQFVVGFVNLWQVRAQSVYRIQGFLTQATYKNALQHSWQFGIVAWPDQFRLTLQIYHTIFKLAFLDPSSMYTGLVFILLGSSKAISDIKQERENIHSSTMFQKKSDTLFATIASSIVQGGVLIPIQCIHRCTCLQ